MGEFSWENHLGYLIKIGIFPHLRSSKKSIPRILDEGPPMPSRPIGEHARLAASSWSKYLPPNHGEVGATSGEGRFVGLDSTRSTEEI